MMKDLTKDEMLWRYVNLTEYITNEIEENNIEVQSEDKDVDYINDLICGSLVYLLKAGAINIVLHNDEDVDGAIFTASREECVNTSWIEPDKDDMTYDERPSDKEIPVPILFDEEGNEKYTRISLVFDFPNSNIGKMCKRMIAYLRNSCKKDVNVINSIVFLKYCVTEELYTQCLRRAMSFAFIDDFWTTSLQIPSEVDDIIGMVMEDAAQDVYDPFMRTGTNLFYANGKYHAQATNKFFMYATMLWAGIIGSDTEHIEYADCVDNWDATGCDFIMVTPEFGRELVTSDGEKESISSFALVKEDRWGIELKGKDKVDFERAKAANKKWYNYQETLDNSVVHISYFKSYDPRWNKNTPEEIKKVADFIIFDFIENILGFTKLNK